jgi:hypothetical protein
MKVIRSSSYLNLSGLHHVGHFHVIFATRPITDTTVHHQFEPSIQYHLQWQDQLQPPSSTNAIKYSIQATQSPRSNTEPQLWVKFTAPSPVQEKSSLK